MGQTVWSDVDPAYFRSNLKLCVQPGFNSKHPTAKCPTYCKTLSDTVADYQYIEYAWQFSVTISVAPRMLIGIYLIKFYQQKLQHQAKGFELKLCYVLIIISEPLFVSIAFFQQ